MGLILSHLQGSPLLCSLSAVEPLLWQVTSQITARGYVCFSALIWIREFLIWVKVDLETLGKISAKEYIIYIMCVCVFAIMNLLTQLNLLYGEESGGGNRNK